MKIDEKNVIETIINAEDPSENTRIEFMKNMKEQYSRPPDTIQCGFSTTVLTPTEGDDPTLRKVVFAGCGTSDEVMNMLRLSIQIFAPALKEIGCIIANDGSIRFPPAETDAPYTGVKH